MSTGELAIRGTDRENTSGGHEESPGKNQGQSVSKPCGFSSLPWEIRSRIYQELDEHEPCHQMPTFVNNIRDLIKAIPASAWAMTTMNREFGAEVLERWALQAWLRDAVAAFAGWTIASKGNDPIGFVAQDWIDMVEFLWKEFWTTFMGDD
ncbi:hypothetical protein BCR34DRAFT_601154 [Clohesyomyces aquaticus]|uniref:Uncharacterized protein n=1 Tax=Clohesyomyces aquaticus TaxID=1231657 RepID=A0A1Y1ZNA7_9PLEO|nr:hypothetical protein BCR34DRAFT_601154 [Clohesyomyces aquaticus]